MEFLLGPCLVLPTDRAATRFVNVENEKAVIRTQLHAGSDAASLVPLLCPGSVEFVLAAVANGVLVKGLIFTSCAFLAHSQPGMMVAW